MMRLTKILVSAIAVGAATLAFATTETQAAGDEALVSVTCNNGNLTAKGVDSGNDHWHVNDAAPWKWDKGEKVSASKESNTWVGKGAKCEGTLKAYVCAGDKCKGPISVPVK